MAKKRRQYTREFKKEAVQLVLGHGLSIAQAARDLGVGESVLGTWVRKARDAAEEGTPLSEDERAELRRLQREVAVLREERDILKKAAAFFAKETR